MAKQSRFPCRALLGIGLAEVTLTAAALLILLASSVNAACLSPTNIAPLGTASQSSLDWGGLPSRAIDGNTDGNMAAGSVTHTQWGPNQWWKVTFQRQYFVQGIVIWPRTDCCQDRLVQVDVTFFVAGRVVNTQYFPFNINTPFAVTVPNAPAIDTVQISMRNGNVLSLAEVQVFGCPTVALTGDCVRPTSWCVQMGQTYKSLDCDGDGALDSWCEEISGNMWSLKSSAGCNSAQVSSYADCPAAKPQGRRVSGDTVQCATSPEGGVASFSCPNGNPITSIVSASYGTPVGSCTAGFTQSTCHAPVSRFDTESLCLGQNACSFPTHNGVFGEPCQGIVKNFASQYTCGQQCSFEPFVSITSYSSFCDSITINWAPCDTCDPGLTPVYTVVLTRRIDGFTRTVFVGQKLSATFNQVPNAMYSLSVTVSCLDSVNQPVCVSAPNVIPGDPDITIFSCCTAQCQGGGWGDPHYRSLDGLQVDYYLPGDYIMLTGNNFEVQARMCYRAWAYSGHCGLSLRCGATTFAVYSSPTVGAELVADLNGAPVALPVGARHVYGPNSQFVITYTNPDPVNRPTFRRIQMSCNAVAVTNGNIVVTGDLNTYGSINVLDLGTTVGTGLYGSRGLLSGNFDGKGGNDIQYRNGIVWKIPKRIDGVLQTISSFVDPALNLVQRSWAVYPGIDSHFIRTIARENSDPSYWVKSARRNVRDIAADARAPPTAQELDAAFKVCSPHIDGGSLALQYLVVDWLAMNKTVPCKQLAPLYDNLDIPDVANIESEAGPTPAPSSRHHRALRQTSSNSTRSTTQPVRVCAAGGNVLRIKGKFSRGVTSATIGAFPAKVVKSARRKAVIETQNFLNAAGVMDLEISDSTGARTTVHGGVEILSSQITSVSPVKAKRGDKLKVNGFFGALGIKYVKIGGRNAKVLQVSRKTLLVEVPNDVPIGVKNVVMDTAACYGAAVLARAVTIIE